MIATPEQEASSAAGRLHELIDGMRRLWRRSVDEKDPDAPVDLYVADTDVMVMFMCPSAVHNYGALLRYDQVARRASDSELMALETQTVEFLGKLLFFQLNAALPVAIMPSHAVELEYKLQEFADEVMVQYPIWRDITVALEAQTKVAYQNSVSGLLGARSVLSNGGGAHAQNVASVIKQLNDILDGFRGSGPLGKLFRFNLLINNERLRHLDHLNLLDGAGATVYLPDPSDAGGAPIARVAVLERRLTKKMLEIHSSKRNRTAPSKDRSQRGALGHRRAIESDAKALAHLAWVNEQLEETPYYALVGGRRRRVGKLVLISGSQRIARAVAELELEALQRVIFVPLAVLGHQMMDDYVRGTAVEVERSGKEALASSLMINFLDSIERSLRRAAADGGSPINHALEKARHNHLKLVESWQERELISRDGAPDAVTDALASLESAGNSFEELHDLVRGLALKAWQTFARSVAFLNYKNADARGLQRNIPPVCFNKDRYPQADKQASDLRTFAFRQNGRSTEGPLNIHQLNNEDPSHYTEFMCYALWDLGHRRQRTARGCVEQALTIAEEAGRARIPERREALFVCAHLMKLCADVPDDLDRARRCIAEIDCLGNAGAYEPTGPVPFDAAYGAADIRYAAEDFSITCHRYYLDVLRMQPTHHSADTVLAIFVRGLGLLPDLPAPGSTDPRDYVSEYTRQQILGNLVQLALLARFGHRCSDANIFEVYSPADAPPAQVAFIESRMKLLAEALIEVCQYLRNDPPPSLPRASLLSVTLAAIAAEVWLNRRDLADWFSFGTVQSFGIDEQRIRYLEGVRQRQRPAAVSARAHFA